MMKLLNDAVQKDPSKIANYTPPAAPHESSLPPPLPNVNARWLYERISESRSAGKMGDNIPQTLVLAEVALGVIQKIKAEGYAEDNNYYNCFFQAFDKTVVPKRDIDLIMDLCDKLEELVNDDGLTADELKKLAP